MPNNLDLSATWHTDLHVHPNFNSPETNPHTEMGPQWFNSLHRMQRHLGHTHPVPFDVLIEALKEHGVWTGPFDKMSEILALFYARMGGNEGDHGYGDTPQERYDKFMSALAKAREEAGQDQDLAKRMHVTPCECMEWRVRQFVVSWFRGYMELMQQIRNYMEPMQQNAQSVSNTLNMTFNQPDCQV